MDFSRALPFHRAIHSSAKNWILNSITNTLIIKYFPPDHGLPTLHEYFRGSAIFNCTMHRPCPFQLHYISKLLAEGFTGSRSGTLQFVQAPPSIIPSDSCKRPASSNPNVKNQAVYRAKLVAGSQRHLELYTQRTSGPSARSPNWKSRRLRSRNLNEKPHGRQRKNCLNWKPCRL